MKNLSILVPAFNEGPRIYGNIKKIEESMHNPEPDYELIVIDNNSMDNTFQEAERAADQNGRVTVVRCLERGKGAALKVGIENSSGNLVSYVDADLDSHPEQLILFKQYMEKYDADIVVGSKRHPLSSVKRSLYRKIFSYFYFLLTRTMFDLPVKDTQVGLKLFKGEVLKEVLPRIVCKKYAFDLEVLVASHHRGFRIVEAPVEIDPKRLKNRIKLSDIWHIFIDTCAIVYRLKILRYYDRALE